MSKVILTGAVPYGNKHERQAIIKGLNNEFDNNVKIYMNNKYGLIEYHTYRGINKNMAYI